MNSSKSLLDTKIKELEEKKATVDNKKNIIEAKLSEKKHLYDNLGGMTEKKLLESLKSIMEKNKFLPINDVSQEVKEINQQNLDKLLSFKEELAIKINNLKSIQDSGLTKGLNNENLLNVKANIELLNNQIELTRDKIEIKKLFIDKAHQRMNTLNQVRIKITKSLEINDDINEQQISIKELNNNIETLIYTADINEIWNGKGLEEFQRYYKNQQEKLDDLSNLIKVNEYEGKVAKLKNELKKLDKIHKEENEEIQSIKKQLLNYEGKLEKVNKELKHEEDSKINQIIYNVQKHILNGEHTSSDCPVCGTDFKSFNNSLQAQVKETLLKSEKKLDEKQQKKLELVSQYNKFEDKYVSVSSKIEGMEENRKNISKNINKLIEKITEIKSNLIGVQEDNGLVKNKKNLESIQKFLHDYEQTFNNISVIQNKKKQKRKLEDSLKELKVLQESIIRSIPSRYKIYNDSTEKINEKVSMYRNYIDLVEERNNYLEEILDNKISNLNLLKQREIAILDLAQKYQNELNYSHCILDEELLMKSIQNTYSNLQSLNFEIDNITQSIYSFINEDDYIKLKKEKDKVLLDLNDVKHHIISGQL
ncbi:hypothetical protein GCM10008986_24820 [Salinibacillus aidingensis]|uniref:Exonuclease SbcC n=1 Tax=Salinibacillus aidingensis TaxID=237684 RepID=A0ABP3LEE9_9BACI